MSETPIDYGRLERLGALAHCQTVTTMALLQIRKGIDQMYLQVRTNAPGVVVPQHIRAKYPENLRIILNQQFNELVVGEEAVSVVVYFGGKPERLVLPFDAMVTFYDSLAAFHLVFPEPSAPQPSNDTVVSLSDFRRQRRPNPPTT